MVLSQTLVTASGTTVWSPRSHLPPPAPLPCPFTSPAPLPAPPPHLLRPRPGPPAQPRSRLPPSELGPEGCLRSGRGAGPQLPGSPCPLLRPAHGGRGPENLASEVHKFKQGATDFGWGVSLLPAQNPEVLVYERSQKKAKLSQAGINFFGSLGARYSA